MWALAEDRDGTMWIGTEKGLCSYRPERGFRAHDLPFPFTAAGGKQRVKQRVKQIVARANGTLWIGSNSGLFRFDPSTGETRLFGAGPNGLNIHGVGALISEPDGGLWIGSTSGWLNYLDVTNESWRQFAITTSDGHPTPEAQVHDLFRDAEGVLWLATTLGLGRFDPETARFELLLGALDLPGSVVFSIQADRKHRLWLGTNQGLVRYDRTQAGEARFRVYDLSDGVGNLEFNRHARWARPDGELLFGGMEGITVFFPNEIHDNPVRPHVAFTQIEILSREGESRREPASVERVVLSPNDTALSFEFTALSYTAPHRIRYAYRMEGLDQAWIDTGHRRFARYSRLPPGEYVFHVKAANNDGLWSKEAAVVAIVVEPHFWRTWWFLAAMIVAALAFTGLVHQARVRRLIASERMRLRIAADLHDDLGSELSGIAVGTALVSNRDYLKEPDRQRLEALSASAFRVMHDLRDVVWTLTPEHDTLGSFTRRLRSTAQHIVPDTDCVFETNCGNSDDPLPMRARRELMAIAKEALANACRHSVAERVEIEFRVEEGHVTLIVADDGVGFDPRARVDGSGLANLRRRARALGAEFILDTRPGGGTRIEVDFQL
ncbi:MAG: hypothetical protein DRH08_14320 [Deltaproteobacteria bacterium]|nr:MAG: hypothetical protein DRH08_14320 [Deltaproteobacteria bacterium]